MIAAGWVDWAERVNVRQDKAYSAVNRSEGIVWHSQEGRGLTAMTNIHNGDSRQTSFMFWIAEDGTLYQFSPISASVWTSGSAGANSRYWPVELEGVAGEPINDAQMRTAIKLIGDWEEHRGEIALRGLGEDDRNLWEHNEVAQKWEPNAGPTACPSGRYDRLWAFLNGGEEDMTDEEFDRRLRAWMTANGFAITTERLNEAFQKRAMVERAASRLEGAANSADMDDVEAALEAVEVISEGLGE